MAACALTLLAATACERACRVTETSRDPAYDWNEVGLATEGGLPVVVIDAGTRGLPPDFRDRLERAFEELTRGREIDFVPVDATDELYRVVLVASPEGTVTDDALCQGVTPPTGPLGAALEIHATYCRGTRPLTGAIGTIDADLIDDPGVFNGFLRGIAVTLFPRNGD